MHGRCSAPTGDRISLARRYLCPQSPLCLSRLQLVGPRRLPPRKLLLVLRRQLALSLRHGRLEHRVAALPRACLRKLELANEPLSLVTARERALRARLVTEGKNTTKNNSQTTLRRVLLEGIVDNRNLLRVEHCKVHHFLHREGRLARSALLYAQNEF